LHTSQREHGRNGTVKSGAREKARFFFNSDLRREGDEGVIPRLQQCYYSY